jgi:hypothetical protein
MISQRTVYDYYHPTLILSEAVRGSSQQNEAFFFMLLQYNLEFINQLYV